MRCLVPTVGTTSRLAALLRARGHDVTEVQVGEIVPVPTVIPPDVDWIAIASQNAIPELLRSLASVPATKLAAVGPATAAALRARGLRVDFVPTVATRAALLSELSAYAPGTKVFLFKGYENREVPLVALVDLASFDAVYFTCASSVDRVLASATGCTRCCAIGPTTAAALRRHGIVPDEAETATLEALAALRV